MELITRAREYTNRILELDEDGLLDRDWLINSLLNWMSEQEVRSFYERVIQSEILDQIDDE
ncbi:MAG: hypothetical protein EB127_02460 [Alphaproteobacteria bacterium]|nr:hypothetical protein [Alphaproteobacteria bacterium]